MNPLLPALFCLCALLAACSTTENTAEQETDSHAEAIWEFQAAQMLFKHAVGTVRDAASYDKAAPSLNLVIEKFRNVAGLMKKLSPPDPSTLGKYRRNIVEGHRKSEPTEQDMQSLLSLTSREKEVTTWTESFSAAGREVGVQIKRLYGNLDHGSEETPQMPLPATAPETTNLGG
jgi:hypothetical protein